MRLLCLVLIAAAAASGQTASTQILGLLTDSTGAGVPGATVTAKRVEQFQIPARDGLIKKGLVYSGERGRIAFTVPHFGQFLRGR